MRARVLVLPAATLLVVGLLLRHSLAIPDDGPTAPVASRESPQTVRPSAHASAPTPRPELPADDVANDDDPVIEEPEPFDNPEGDNYMPGEGQREIDVLPPVSPNTIHGHITDTRGMPVSGAVVTVRETGTRVLRAQSTVSGDSGYYALSDLRLGSYEVTFTFEGQRQQYELDIDGKTEVVAEPVLAALNGDFDIPEPVEPVEDQPAQVEERPSLSINRKDVLIDYEYEL